MKKESAQKLREKNEGHGSLKLKEKKRIKVNNSSRTIYVNNYQKKKRE